MPPEKVLLVTNQDWGHYAHRLPVARALREVGLEAVFVSAPGPYVPYLENAGFRFIPWQVDRRSLNPLREMAPLIDLTRIYRKERPVAVLHFTIKPILYGSLAARLAHVPATANFFTGVGFPFLDFGPSRYYRPLLSPVLRLLLRSKQAFTVFHNDEDRQSLIDRGIVTAKRSTTIYSSGVDTGRFAPRDTQALNDPPVVLMAARLLWDKGIKEYVDAARKVRSRGVPGRFLVAGAPDPGSTVAVNDDHIAAWRAEGIVEFLGHEEDMSALLRDSDIAVLPSYHEGVPRFLLEAASTGLPIVATDISGCRVVVHAGVNGILVPVRDSSILADAIETILSDIEQRHTMGQASRKIALEQFNQNHAMRAHIDVLRKLGCPIETQQS